MFRALTLVALALSTAIHASPEGGISGGGGKIARQISTERLALYDFLENGLEGQAAVAPLPPTNLVPAKEIQRLREVVAANLAPLQQLQGHDETMDLIVRVLANLQTLSPTFSGWLEETMGTLAWRAVDMSLVETRDIGKTPVRLNDDWELLQAAFRNDRARSVTFDRSLVARLAPLDRAGLVLHEIYYSLEIGIALSMPIHDPRYPRIVDEMRKRGSSDARALVALTFSPPINTTVFRSVLEGFPNINTRHKVFDQLADPAEVTKCLRWNHQGRAALAEKAWREYSRLNRVAEQRMVEQKTKLGSSVIEVRHFDKPTPRDKFLESPHISVQSFQIVSKAQRLLGREPQLTSIDLTVSDTAELRSMVSKLDEKTSDCKF